MTFNYSGIASTALALIADFGRSVTLRRVTAGTYTPSSLSVSGASTSDETITAVIMKHKFHQIDGEIIRRDDRLCLVAASGLTVPALGDIIISDSVQMKIVDVEVVQPGDTAVVYRLNLRK